MSLRVVSWAQAAAVAALLALSPSLASAQSNLVVNGTTFNIGPSTTRRYDHICVINGGRVTVSPYAGGDPALQGNLELIAGSVYVDATSSIVARGSGYQPQRCDDGAGPTATAGGRGGCSVADSGGGGAHFGRGGRGTIDAPTIFPMHFEDDCNYSPNAGLTACTNTADCGNVVAPCADGRGGRFCRIGNSVAGLSYWHNIYEPEFGAAGGDKGCRDGDGFGSNPTTGGPGGGRVVIVGLSHLTTFASSSCGVNLPRGSVRIDGDIDASGKRGCGNGNDSGGGGAGGTVLIVGENVQIGAQSVIEAAGGLGGDTHSAAMGQPDYLDCPAGSQTSGTCDDCGGGGGGGIISVLSVQSNIDSAARFDVSGAEGGTCDVCKGEAGGGAGELQLDGAYVGEYCDGYDNDFDGSVDEDQGMQSCGLGACEAQIQACTSGEAVSCMPTVSADPSCTEDPTGARPRIAVILDTSASMLLSLDGYPTFGDGSVDHPGLDLDSDGEPNDSRLYLARTSLAEVISAYPEIDFAFARYHQDQAAQRNCQTASWFECNQLVASYDDPTGNTGPTICSVDLGSAGSIDVLQNPQTPEECINYAGSCGPPRRGADILSGFGTPVRDIVRWLDGRETDFRASATPGNVCDHRGGGDCEVRGSGPTPLAGSLLAIEDYVVPIRTTDGAAACRGYSVILVTDGAESCNGDPVAAAQRLHDDEGIDTYVIAVSVLPEEEASLNAIAVAGGTTAATFVTAPEQLVPALTTIIASSIRVETCNNLDDDCDAIVDEGLPKFCDKPNGIDDETLCSDPGESLCDGQDDDCDGIVDDGVQNACGGCGAVPAEVCDGFDNDCDGPVDEGTGGGACGEDQGQCEMGTLTCVGGNVECRGEVAPAPETCDCQDDDCDGTVDEDPSGTLCEGSRCIGCECVPRCSVTDEFEPSCPDGLRTDFQPNGECLCIEDECDAQACAGMTLERDGEVACSPDDTSLAPCLCRAGACVAICDGRSCGDNQICNPRNGQCVENNCRGLGCPDGQVCDPVNAECIVDECADAGCEDDQVCRGGRCETSCADVQCGSRETCLYGRCVELNCSGVRCNAGLVCDEATGSCVPDRCALVLCAEGLECSRDSGECERNACWNVHCPSGQLCVGGQCTRIEDGSGGSGAPGTEDSLVLATGGGGCACSVPGEGGRSGDGATLALIAAALLWVRRRRQTFSRGAWLAAIALVAIALGGCTVNPFCLECVDGSGASDAGVHGDGGGAGGMSGGSGGMAGGGNGGGGGDAGVIDGDGGRCVPAAEVCNDMDDDCDFRVDEETTSETNDCDQLGVCAGTQPTCVAGEFTCIYPSTRQDDETRCNGEDDDCDGRVDEAFADLGTACSVGIGACATAGEMACDAAGTGLRCAIGDMPEPSDESCDGVDNDCDGMTDEPESEPGSHPSFVHDAFTQLGASLWMYTYEASRPDASSSDAGSATARSCSKAGVLPWTNVSFASASAACAFAGYRLCTASEWQSACEGASSAVYPYGDDYDADTCNGADHDVSNAAGLQNALLPTGSRSACVSDDGLFDLSGNAKEWTDDPQGSVSGQTIYVVRGGSYDSPQYGLTCATALSQQIGSTVLPTLGFRCCSDVEP